MKITIGFRDEVKASAQATDTQEVQWSDDSKEAQSIASYYQKLEDCNGVDLLKLLTKRMKGQWWAVESTEGEDQQNKAAQRQVLKASGPCKVGQTAAGTGCVPANSPKNGLGTPASKPARSSSLQQQSPTETGSRQYQGGKQYEVSAGNFRSKYTLHEDKRIDGPSIPLKNYKQQDDHSCGFVAALTVSRLLNPTLSAKEVLSAIKPTKSAGIDGKSMVGALRNIGIAATYRSNLTLGSLKQLVTRGTPVMLTVYPEDWSSDHWVVVQGFDDKKIYLTNYKSLPIEQFKHEWFDKGEGLVCQPMPDKKSWHNKNSPVNRLVTKTGYQTDAHVREVEAQRDRAIRAAIERVRLSHGTADEPHALAAYHAALDMPPASPGLESERPYRQLLNTPTNRLYKSLRRVSSRPLNQLG